MLNIGRKYEEISGNPSSQFKLSKHRTMNLVRYECLLIMSKNIKTAINTKRSGGEEVLNIEVLE